MQDEGEKVDPEDLDSTHELADEPDDYAPHLDVDFTPIRGDGPPTDGFSQAA